MKIVISDSSSITGGHSGTVPKQLLLEAHYATGWTWRPWATFRFTSEHGITKVLEFYFFSVWPAHPVHLSDLFFRLDIDIGFLS